MIMTDNNMVKNINQNLVVVDNYSIFRHPNTPINNLKITFTDNSGMFGIIIR